MNQTQRAFLIDKIKKEVKLHLDSLKGEIPERPSLNAYLLHAVMSNNFDVIDKTQIKKILLERALKSTDREDWLGNGWGSASKDNVFFKARDFFIVPEEYTKVLNEYIQKKNEIEKKMAQINIQSDTLITRIQLASDKTLQRMINEVDDMGDISLMDAKLKMISSPNTQSNE